VYPTQVLNQPKQKISEIFSMKVDIGAENTPPKIEACHKEKECERIF
jgi:dihydropteroate synthase